MTIKRRSREENSCRRSIDAAALKRRTKTRIEIEIKSRYERSHEMAFENLARHFVGFLLVPRAGSGAGERFGDLGAPCGGVAGVPADGIQAKRRSCRR